MGLVAANDDADSDAAVGEAPKDDCPETTKPLLLLPPPPPPPPGAATYREDGRFGRAENGVEACAAGEDIAWCADGGACLAGGGAAPAGGASSGADKPLREPLRCFRRRNRDGEPPPRLSPSLDQDALRPMGPAEDARRGAAIGAPSPTPLLPLPKPAAPAEPRESAPEGPERPDRTEERPRCEGTAGGSAGELADRAAADEGPTEALRAARATAVIAAAWGDAAGRGCNEGATDDIEGADDNEGAAEGVATVMVPVLVSVGAEDKRARLTGDEDTRDRLLAAGPGPGKGFWGERKRALAVWAGEEEGEGRRVAETLPDVFWRADGDRPSGMAWTARRGCCCAVAPDIRAAAAASAAASVAAAVARAAGPCRTLATGRKRRGSGALGGTPCRRRDPTASR